MNEMLELIKKRQSCRAYKKAPIEKEKLFSILEAGRLSPSARNSQPWSLTLVMSDDAVYSVGECTRANGKNAFTVDCSAYIIITEEECEAAFGGMSHRYFAEMDIGMCVMNMCLEAESLGIGSCIIGSFDMDKIKEVAFISKDKTVKLVIALGYAIDGYEVRPKKRKSFDEVVSII